MVGGQVRLNPALLGPIFGEDPKEVEAAIEFLCSPDSKTSTPGEEGRRLVRLSQFDYRVVNAVKYHELRNEEERRKQNREAQEKFREKQKMFEGLSEDEKEILAKAFDREKKRRKKNGESYKADLSSAGKKAGAQSAINDGLRQATT